MSDPAPSDVIVIPAHGGLNILTDPVDARDRIGAVIHQIAEKQADIERLLDRAQGGPVRVNVGDQ